MHPAQPCVNVVAAPCRTCDIAIINYKEINSRTQIRRLSTCDFDGGGTLYLYINIQQQREMSRAWETRRNEAVHRFLFLIFDLNELASLDWYCRSHERDSWIGWIMHGTSVRWHCCWLDWISLLALFHWRSLHALADAAEQWRRRTTTVVRSCSLAKLKRYFVFWFSYSAVSIRLTKHRPSSMFIRWTLGRLTQTRQWYYTVITLTVLYRYKCYDHSDCPSVKIVECLKKRLDVGLYSFYRAMRCISAVFAVMQCLSVRLSVTFVDHVKTNKHIIEIFSPSGSDTILVFSSERGCRYSDGNPPNGGRRMQGGMKNPAFRPLFSPSRSIS